MRRRTNRDREMWETAKNGEILDLSVKKSQHRAETLFESRKAPYVWACILALVDIAVFFSLFAHIGYDSPALIMAQIAIFLIVFDVLPIYLGLLVKKQRQGLEVEKRNIIIIVVLIILGFVLNMILRIMTIELLSGSSSAASVALEALLVNETESEIPMSDIGYTLFSIVSPMICAVLGYAVSYINSNPLQWQAWAQEDQIRYKQDEVRRVEAIVNEYENNKLYAQNLLKDDEDQFIASIYEIISRTTEHCIYVRQKLKEHLLDPASSSALSVDPYQKISFQLLKHVEETSTRIFSAPCSLSVHSIKEE